ncbi:MAG TPA: fumarylacetoacetate hydrolase family protein [Hyphomicrobiales bacterium]|nr:fumarylacetoacetate hydrolase family protein [Hyphomicrobiales bacterium]
MSATDDPLFPPRPLPLVPVRDSSRGFPIHRIFCVGRNYAAHAAEMGATAVKEDPFYFTKSPFSYVASGATIPYPPGTADCHHEMELVAAIGAAGFRLPLEKALDLVFGYACGLDLTRRDLQGEAKDKRRPWDLGKDFENAAVLSEIVPAAAIGHPTAGRIELSVNGETRQSGDLAEMINSVAETIVHLSRFYHLAPGDLVYTGTPSGVGPVVPGDRLEGRIDGVGEITLTIGEPE